MPDPPKKKGAINRFLNYYSYPFHSKRALKRLKNDFDVVFVYQLSPVMMANAGSLAWCAILCHTWKADTTVRAITEKKEIKISGAA